MIKKLVLIDWVDSRQPVGSWHHLEDWEVAKACECQSVGFLVKDNDNVKAIAQNLADIDDPDLAQASGVITIPTECIKKVTELSRPATSVITA